MKHDESWGIFYVFYPVKVYVVGQEDSPPVGLGLSLIFAMALAECFRAFSDMNLMNYKNLFFYNSAGGISIYTCH